MCFQEFIGYSCGHCSMSVLRPCPLTTSEHKNPVCELQGARPFVVDMMCPVCSRVMHSRAVLIQEWEHHFLHERGACGCDVIFPDLVRPRVIGGPSVFQKNVQEGGHADATATDGKKAPPMLEQFAGPEGQEAFAIRLPSLYAAEWVDDHAELHRSGECKCNADFNRYKPEWVDGATEPQYYCREWQKLHHTGAGRPTIDDSAGPVPQLSLTYQQDVQGHAQPQANDDHERDHEHQEQAQDNNNETQEKNEAQEDEEQPQVYYATPVHPSKRSSRRSLSADLTRSIMLTCGEEEYDDFESSSPIGDSSASEAGEPHLYHARRRQRRASSIDIQLNSSASDQSQASPTDANTSGNTDIGVQDSGNHGNNSTGKAATATTAAQETREPATPVNTTVTDVASVEEASWSRRHVTFSDEVVKRQSVIDFPAQDDEGGDDDDDEFPAPPTTLPGPGEVHMYPAGPKYSKYWGPNIYPRPQDDVFRRSATAAQQQGQDATTVMSKAMGQMRLRSSQDATSAPVPATASCSRGLQVGDVNSLTSLAPMRYPTGTILVDSNGAPAANAKSKSNLGKAPSCKPIAGLPIGAGPEGTFRHMPAFGDCALKTKHPKGVRSRHYN